MFYLHRWLADPNHRIRIFLAGVGGTGSFVLPELVLLSKTLKQLGRKEFQIFVFDPDIVEAHNVGRQKFFEADIGLYKAETLVRRVNRAFNTDVEFFNREMLLKDIPSANIIITCVDNLKLRKKLSRNLRRKSCGDSFQQTYYWFDCGNSRDYGQVTLGSYSRRKKERLPSVIERYPDMTEDATEPSCSVRASLNQQSFMVNKMTGVLLMEMISSLFLEFQLETSEVFFNLKPFNIKTRKI